MDAPQRSARRQFAMMFALLLPVVSFAVLMVARTPTATTPESVCLAAYGPNTVNDGGGAWSVKSSRAETERRVSVTLTTGCNDSTCTAVRRDRDWVAEPGFVTLKGCLR